jgi:hypothetical protein
VLCDNPIVGPRFQTVVQTEEQFKTLLNVLISDLGKVNDYLTLFKNLVDGQQEYWRGMAGAPAFWSTTRQALQDAALYGLARAYDWRDDALTLKTMLKTIESAPSFLTHPEDFDTAQLAADLIFVQRETNPVVMRLMVWRNKFFAHRDPIKIIDARKLSDDHPLAWTDIDSLLDTGFRILNRYSIDFFRTSTLANVHGHQDYLTVLKTLQQDAEAHYNQLQEEIRRLQRLPEDPPEPGTSGT